MYLSDEDHRKLTQLLKMLDRDSITKIVEFMTYGDVETLTKMLLKHALRMDECAAKLK